MLKVGISQGIQPTHRLCDIVQIYCKDLSKMRLYQGYACKILRQVRGEITCLAG